MLRMIALFTVVGCSADETVSAYADGMTNFSLISLGGQAYSATATIDVGMPGEISGAAPCNGYRAKQLAPYPWFEIGPIVATRRACLELAAETAFFDALSRMTLVEVASDTLILSNTDGFEMVFQALP